MLKCISSSDFFNFSVLDDVYLSIYIPVRLTDTLISQLIVIVLFHTQVILLPNSYSPNRCILFSLNSFFYHISVAFWERSDISFGLLKYVVITILLLSWQLNGQRTGWHNLAWACTCGWTGHWMEKQNLAKTGDFFAQIIGSLWKLHKAGNRVDIRKEKA